MRRAVAAAVLAALVAACGSAEHDTPEVAAKKTQCRALEAHVFRISPQSAPRFAGLAEPDAQKLADSMVAQLAAEDIDECVAAEPEIVACMLTAPDVAAVKRCIPPASVIACMQREQDHPAQRAACRDGVH